MPRTEVVPITGLVLKWALEQAGLSEEELARRLELPTGVIYEWEDEQASKAGTGQQQLDSYGYIGDD